MFCVTLEPYLGPVGRPASQPAMHVLPVLDLVGPASLTIATEVVTLRGIADAAAGSDAASAADSTEANNDSKEMVANPTFDSENDR